MGIILAGIAPATARRDELLPMTTGACADRGAVRLDIPRHVANRPEPDVAGRREVAIVASRRVEPARVRRASRAGHPVRPAPTVNPARPDSALSLAMGARPAAKDAN